MEGRIATVRRFGTFTDALRQLRAWLVAEGVTQVAMEATGAPGRPHWHVLEAVPEFELLLANAHAVKNMPGRKTDVADAEWLALLCECGLLRPSFVPPPVIAELRDLTRYRKKLIEERSRETQRVQKLLEDAGIKLDSVVSDILGVSARQMLEALIAGVRDVAALAELAALGCDQDPAAAAGPGRPLRRPSRADAADARGTRRPTLGQHRPA